ncbi:copper homeostasis protein CutC [Ferruginibacter sp. HRS2-29]|uniref:copper homeostasis protein CutC n=1 Tax=Ferruginibacter sp. HRS2-29 TaxID=2487334 RepID=UPI0020CEA76F|nr:copper homeostasis protein CutC [Ferruginibacter sp. HRS2-29]MCP9751406.1 copper homeostasis protein CutC [Ferruginibacter sp. HRS2-29]
MFSLEVIAFNIQSCLSIEASGAHRIELCDNPGEGGTTPSKGFIEAARKNVSIDLFPIIRPRGGDFLYSSEEFAIMKSDVLLCKQIGCDGVVIGILNTDGSIDMKRCSELVKIAYPMSVTFHRAFDRVNDHQQALENVIGLGCERILTSGFYPTAMEGASNIAQLIRQANERIVIMPGSGVRSSNIAELAQLTGAVEFHSSARSTINSKMEFKSQTMNEDLKSVNVDEGEVRKILEVIS